MYFWSRRHCLYQIVICWRSTASRDHCLTFRFCTSCRGWYQGFCKGGFINFCSSYCNSQRFFDSRRFLLFPWTLLFLDNFKHTFGIINNPKGVLSLRGLIPTLVLAFSASLLGVSGFESSA